MHISSSFLVNKDEDFQVFNSVFVCMYLALLIGICSFFSWEVKLNVLLCCTGISLKTQELYALVFLARYLDLFTDFISVYNTIMKLVFIGSSLAILWCMRFHRVVRRSYDHQLDTFRHYFLVGASFLLALLVHEKFTFQEVSLLSLSWSSPSPCLFRLIWMIYELYEFWSEFYQINVVIWLILGYGLWVS